MSRLTKIVSAFFLIGLVAGVMTYLYVFHKPHRDVQQEEVQFVLTAAELLDHFVSDPNAAQARFNEAVVKVSGVAVMVEPKAILLEGGAYCQLLAEAKHQVQEGDAISLKARVVGYDELLEEVKLDQAQVVN